MLLSAKVVLHWLGVLMIKFIRIQSKQGCFQYDTMFASLMIAINTWCVSSLTN